MRSKDPKNLQVGDVVEVRWTDVYQSDKLTYADIAQLEEVEQTRTFGVVVRMMERCVVVAWELGDKHGDGCGVEQLPFSLIESVRVFGHVKVKM